MIVQLLAGFVLLALVAAASRHAIPDIGRPFSQLDGVVAILVIVGQVGVLGWLVIGALGVVGVLLVAQSLFGHKPESVSRSELMIRGVVGPGMATLVGVLLVLNWQDAGGSLEARRLVHFAVVLLLWALSGAIDAPRKTRLPVQLSL